MFVVLVPDPDPETEIEGDAARCASECARSIREDEGFGACFFSLPLIFAGGCWRGWNPFFFIDGWMDR